MALGESLERGEPRGRLDLALRKVVAECAHELVDLAERVARDLLHRVERGPGAGRIALLEQSGRTGLDEDDVDRVPGRVVQVAGDAHALLRGGEPALALGLSLGVPGALLELGDPLASQPGTVPGEPGGRPHAGAEEELGREAVPHEVRAQESNDARGESRPAQPGVLGTLVRHGVERDGEAEGGPSP